MSDKLLTLQELSEYLGIRQEKIIDLVEEKVISAYKIGGELLRFRKEQIDAIRSEIESRLKDPDRLKTGDTSRGKNAKNVIRKVARRSHVDLLRGTFRDELKDFLYFNDFNIIASILALILLVFIIRGL